MTDKKCFSLVHFAFHFTDPSGDIETGANLFPVRDPPFVRKESLTQLLFKKAEVVWGFD